MKEHLLAEEEATKNLRRKMETLRTQKSSSPPPSPYQQDRQEKDLSQKPNRQKDLDPVRSRGVVGRELSETPTSAILPGGKVEKAILPEGKVEKVEDQPSASRGKRPTWQNAATSNDGTASQAPLTREKLTAEAEKLTTGETEEKQKFTPRQNIGVGLDPGKSQKLSPDNGSTHNGMSKAALIEKSKPEPSKSHQPPAAKDKPETKTAPWRQGRSSQQVEEKVEKKVVSKSKREEQEKKVQEFLRDPSAPAGSTVPLEVRLRKPGKIRDEFANLKMLIACL